MRFNAIFFNPALFSTLTASNLQFIKYKTLVFQKELNFLV